MSVLLSKRTKVIVQGMGREGRFHAGRMKEYGTQVVGGVGPGTGGTERDGIPMFDTVAAAVDATGADASLIFVPAPGAADAILEAVDAELGLVVCITEGIPVHDMLRVAAVLAETSTILIGPNCPGAITPGECKIGIMPGENFSPGPVGFVSRSGTLTYEIADALTRAGLGQSTCIGIGGDPVIGLPTPDAVRLLNEDPATGVIVIVGEIGGSAEERAAEYMRAHGKKPAIAFIAGRSAPPGKRMGHAGAIVSGNQGTAESKVRAFQEAGIPVANAPSEIPKLVKEALGASG
jgi:succinyl-CoA synthetase alpha subunit